MWWCRAIRTNGDDGADEGPCTRCGWIDGKESQKTDSLEPCKGNKRQEHDGYSRDRDNDSDSEQNENRLEGS